VRRVVSVEVHNVNRECRQGIAYRAGTYIAGLVMKASGDSAASFVRTPAAELRPALAVGLSTGRQMEESIDW
jgi:hypothetical protein